MSLLPAELQDVTVSAGGRSLLRDVTLTVHPGEALLLQGAGGSGKTTLLRLLAGERQTSAVRARQRLNVVGPDSEAALLRRDWPQPVAGVLLSALQEDRWAHQAAAQAARLAEVARLTGLEDLLERDFRTLSHGQRRRVSLARALMPGPELLLLDEFTDGLSPAARAELGAVLRGLHSSGTAVVLASHRPDEAPDLGWRVLQVAGGQVSAAPPALPEPVAVPGPLAGVHLAAPADPPALLVRLQDAEVYRGNVRALGPLSWEWHGGQHWLVTGENGSGKSTLTRLIYGEFQPALGGTVSRPFLPRDVISERRRAFGLVGAELGIRQRRGWTGSQILGSAFAGTEGFMEPLTSAQSTQLQELAARLELQDLLDRDARTLSQGQLRRLLLARAVLHRPRLLLLDEGLDFVDARSRILFLQLLPELTAGGTHILLVAHRPQDVPAGITHHLHLEGGRAAGVEKL
ncbi:ATP-binding cassette domain-containing protein [Deinococcus sp. Marseille-Q6407]|uniref:ATP-binding cassette domain-containing protein n=1 Tax=Deinococcus sp. Marseille-Q6407 TaxID=2969223 RepID=UPI0021C13E95|nr:ATP-binding cassette domain-containing protein [Deinococcus sp. Marseille-Q6407]